MHKQIACAVALGAVLLSGASAQSQPRAAQIEKGAAGWPAVNEIETLHAAKSAGGADVVEIGLRKPTSVVPPSRLLDNPPRVVVDLPAGAGGYGNEAIKLTDASLIRTVSVERSAGVSRVVILLRRAVPHRVQLAGANLRVVLGDEVAVAAVASSNVAPTAVAAGSATSSMVDGKGDASFGRVHFIGIAPAEPGASKGFARGIALRDALKQFVPASMTVYPASERVMSRLVDWQGDSSWIRTLESVIDQSNGAAVINWTERTIVIADSMQIARAYRTGERWELRDTDVRLSSALERWGKQAGWRVFWEAERDFEVAIPATFAGTFEDALESVLAAYQGSDYPLQACLHADKNGNKAVRVMRFGERNKCE